MMKTRLYIKKLYSYLLICLFILISTSFFSQNTLGFEFDNSIPVKIGSESLDYNWFGGINNAQISTIDFDYDGDDDLFIFDRSSNQIRLLEHKVTGSIHFYDLFQNAESLFPEDIRYRCQLVDFDTDGKKDLFTYSIGGLAVYKNTGNLASGLQWTLFKDIVYTDYLGSQSNLFVSSADLPALSDVDNDSDLDVLTFHIGGERIEYYQNQSFELYGHNDSLTFVLMNECWGQFREDINNNNVFLNNTTFPCGSGNITNPQKPSSTLPGDQKHAGSNVLAIDIDGNGVKDLVLGDIAHTTATLLINGGTAPNTNSPMISQDNFFPSNSVPIDVNLFPAFFFEDVDFDGKKDLISTPSARNVSENRTSVLFYKNQGTNAIPNFNFIENDFLQGEMIDNGLGSIPTMVDQNGDGKKDLVIGNFYRYKPVLSKESALISYRNTGSSLSPEYTFLDNDFLNLSSGSYGLRIVPSFADTDNDGDQDLYLGNEFGTILYFQNNAGAGNPISYLSPITLLDSANATITVNSYSFPQLIDLNSDNLLDLVIGKKTGEIVYYQNIGTSTTPKFVLRNSQLGNVDISSSPDGYAAPHFFKVNDSLQLFVGAYDGNLHYYKSIEGNLTAGQNFELVSHNYLNINTGTYSSFWVEEIDGDTNLNMFVGQDLG
ncbi:MAG: FG-GAP repeat domain-containing protein, partial [Fluviicola sp.]